MQKSMMTPVNRLVTSEMGTSYIRSAPIQFSSTWTPTGDYDAATKIYVDDEIDNHPYLLRYVATFAPSGE